MTVLCIYFSKHNKKKTNNPYCFQHILLTSHICKTKQKIYLNGQDHHMTSRKGHNLCNIFFSFHDNIAINLGSINVSIITFIQQLTTSSNKNTTTNNLFSFWMSHSRQQHELQHQPRSITVTSPSSLQLLQ